MDNNYFVYNGKKYIVEYKDKNMNVYKFNDGKIEILSDEEIQMIRQLLNSKYNYEYDSITLTNLVNANLEMENKEYIMNFLNWLESIIPEECRDNFYRNIKTLKTTLNTNIDLSKFESSSSGYSTSVNYNTSSNSLVMNEKSLHELWKIAQLNNNPQEFYWRHYSQTLLHELAHMASSRYDSDTKISLC